VRAGTTTGSYAVRVRADSRSTSWFGPFARSRGSGIEVSRLVVFVRPEVNPRVAPPLRLSENGVQEDASDSLAPSLRDDEEEVEEAAAGYDWTSPALAAKRLDAGHPD